MKIKATIDKVPRGMMVVPLIIGAFVKTFFPEFLKIGPFSSEIANNPLAILGVFLVCMGAGMDVQAAPKLLKVGAVQTVTKYGIAVVVGLLVSYFFGANGLWGISSLAFIAPMSSTNGGLYTALTAEYGSKEEVGAIAVLSIKYGPFLTMIALGTAGLASIPLMTLVGVILPLGLLTVVVCGFFTIMTYKLSGGTGVAGAANASTAGNAVATLAAVTMVDPSLTTTAALATPQVAAAVIITALLVPVLMSYIAKKNKQKLGTL